MTGSKRKRILHDFDEDSAAKRTRPETTASSTKPPQFQCFHLMLLQSLYDTDSNEPVKINRKDEDSLGSVTDDSLSEIMDDAVDDKLWSKAHKFVQERDHLITLKKEACRVNNVHQEALNYIEEQGSVSPFPSTPSGKQTTASWQCWTDDNGPNSGGIQRSVNSPNSLSFFSPQRPATSSRPQESSPAHCFGLFANLLKKRRQSVNSNVNHCSKPYKPVLQEIEEKIETLEGKLERLQENALSEQKQKVEDLLSCALLSSYNNPGGRDESDEMTADLFDTKSSIAKLESKLSLWNMLATDLKDLLHAS